MNHSEKKLNILQEDLEEIKDKTRLVSKEILEDDKYVESDKYLVELSKIISKMNNLYVQLQEEEENENEKRNLKRKRDEEYFNDF